MHFTHIVHGMQFRPGAYNVSFWGRVICHEVSPSRRFGKSRKDGNQQPETTFERCSFDFRIPRRHDVDGIAPCAQIARLFDDVGKFSMFKINLCNFPTKARLNFRWIFKGFDLKSIDH